MGILENCKTCRYAMVGYRDGYLAKMAVPECHRYAPRHFSGAMSGYESNLFPEVSLDNWCGEWLLNDFNNIDWSECE